MHLSSSFIFNLMVDVDIPGSSTHEFIKSVVWDKLLPGIIWNLIILLLIINHKNIWKISKNLCSPPR